MEKEQDMESSLPKYERDYGEHGPIAGKPPNQDHGQTKNKRPPQNPANFEHNDDSPPFDQDNNADVKERGYTSPPGVDIEVGDEPQSSKMEDIAGLPHGDHQSLRIDNLSPRDDGMEEEEKLSRPTSVSSKNSLAPLPPLPDVEGCIMEAVEITNTHMSGGEQFSMPKSLSSQLDEKFSQPTSLSLKDGWVPLPPLPDVEGRFMQAVEMTNTHLSGGEQFSMPKSLSSQLDEKFSQPTSLSSKDDWVTFPPLPDVEGGFMQAVDMPKSLSSQLGKILPRPFQASKSKKKVSRRSLNCYKFKRANGRQYGRKKTDKPLRDMIDKLRMEVDCLNAMRDRNKSAGLNGANADKRGTIPWQIFVYDDLKKRLKEFTRVHLPKMACWSFLIAVGYIYGRSE